MKVPRYKPFGELVPLKIPNGLWEGIAIDFIVGLPPLAHRNNVYDAVLVVVDRFSKFVRFILCTNKMTVEELGTVLIDDVFTLFGFPTSMVTDCGSLFTSAYWETLCYFLAVKRRLSIAFHP